ncbi:MAG: hypothetical protein ACOYOQ_00250 [Microthrixaceae bacterium]
MAIEGYTPRQPHPKPKPKPELIPYDQRAARESRPRPSPIFVLERRKQAVLLRIAGLTNIEIGMQLHCDPAVNPTGQSFIGGYGWYKWVTGDSPLTGAGLGKAVSIDINRHYDGLSEDLEEARERYRQLELDRLDAAQRAIWTRVQQGNDWAIDRLLAIMGHRAKLLGLEKSAQVTVSGGIGISYGAMPEVNAEFAEKMLDGIKALAAAENGESDDVIDVEPID